MKLLIPSSARSWQFPPKKKQRSDACQQVTESGAARDCLETHAENKDGHNVLIYA